MFGDIGTSSLPSSKAASDHVSLVEKPLPSPSLWGHFSIGCARATHRTTKKIAKVKKIRWLRKLLFSGWRSTLTAGICVGIIVLLVNVVVLIWGFTRPTDPKTGMKLIAEGSCSSTQSIFKWLHLAINVLSTILLATSSATMQYLSAPTRKAVGVAPRNLSRTFK
jgi:hypothetical protein